MPVRSLNSSVLVWPDRALVDHSARTWAARTARQHPGVQRIGYFGSFARGDWGVGSDLDLVAIVERSDQPFECRSVDWPLEQLPVPADMIVYTSAEFEQVLARNDRFARVLGQEVIWIWPDEDTVPRRDIAPQ
jgi:predicted nucleotidyltransferase